MHKERRKQEMERLKQFKDRVQQSVIRDRRPLVATVMRSTEPTPYERRREGAHDPIAVGDVWGRTWDSAWFHITGEVPREWAGRSVALNLDLTGEALIFDAQGCPCYGLTSSSVYDPEYRKTWFRLLEPARGGEQVDLWVEAAANTLFGIKRPPQAARDAADRHGTHEGRVKELELVVLDEEVWGLGLDLDVYLSLAQGLEEDSPRRGRIVRALGRAASRYADHPDNAAACREQLRELRRPANASDLKVAGIGHAHIDTAWLWPMRETIRKCARTFSSQIANLERYPDYVFGASQPQLYAFVKKQYPALYEKIRQAVREGRWELQGGMWVEADCNIISGESMVRQFLHGKNFFMDEFGVDVRNLWLPDVFGYSAAMPQILKQAGVDFFMTQKISWNQYNQFPFFLFNWRGIDGTEIVTHFLPENTYNASTSPQALIEAQKRFTENDLVDEFVSLYGIGDGGGGPREEHIERALRCGKLEGCPDFHCSAAHPAFERMLARRGELDTWSGELYLELHRGTLTTQARTKKWNRLAENRLRNVELLYSGLPLELYPATELDQAWKTVLTQQFHDILPGSSIHRVYEEAEAELESVVTLCDELLEAGGRQAHPASPQSLVAVNTLSLPYQQDIRLPAAWRDHGARLNDGTVLPVQPIEDGLMVRVALPALAHLSLYRTDAPPQPAVARDAWTLENELVRYVFAQDGSIRQATDKASGRELLQGPGNQLSLYEDRPTRYDAWEVDVFYETLRLENARPLSARRTAEGPLHQELVFELAIGESTITQTVRLPSQSKRLDFSLTVDWRERHRMLRTAFPTTIVSQEASFDIQYGYVRRPTHRNTMWDLARFEVVAHKYADLSDAGYGVALLNDGKYGHKVHDGVIDLNLLRSPTDPDPDADQGCHHFAYSLLPHDGDLTHSDVIEQALMFNRPPVLLPDVEAGAFACPVFLDSRDVSLEVVKKAEKSEALVIRLVELRGRHGKIDLTVRRPGSILTETDLMEWRQGEARTCDEPVTLSFTPFQIRSFLLTCSQS